jgi:hypothetical protein
MKGVLRWQHVEYAPSGLISQGPLSTASEGDTGNSCPQPRQSKAYPRKLTLLRSFSSAVRRATEPRDQISTKRMGGDMAQTRAADDLATIRARMEELRREREGAEGAEMLQPQPRNALASAGLIGS